MGPATGRHETSLSVLLFGHSSAVLEIHGIVVHLCFQVHQLTLESKSFGSMGCGECCCSDSACGFPGCCTVVSMAEQAYMVLI